MLLSRGFDIICGVIKHRINVNDKSMMILIVGEMGSGKSLAAVSFACKVDPSFKKNSRIVYTVEDFLKELNHIKKGQAIIFDEVGVNVAARDFQKLNNRIMSIITQVLRYKNVCCIFTTPNARFVDINVRESMNAWIHPISIDREHNINTCSYKELITNDEGQVLKRHFKYFDGSTGAAGEIIHPVHVPRPDSDIEEYYQKLSHKMKDEKLKELQLGIEEDSPNPMKIRAIQNKADACTNLIRNLKASHTWEELAAASGYTARVMQMWVRESASGK